MSEHGPCVNTSFTTPPVNMYTYIEDTNPINHPSPEPVRKHALEQHADDLLQLLGAVVQRRHLAPQRSGAVRRGLRGDVGEESAVRLGGDSCAAAATTVPQAGDKECHTLLWPCSAKPSRPPTLASAA